MFNAETGACCLSAIVEVDGSRPAMDSVTDFPGRMPEIYALLRHQGMA